MGLNYFRRGLHRNVIDSAGRINIQSLSHLGNPRIGRATHPPSLPAAREILARQAIRQWPLPLFQERSTTVYSAYEKGTSYPHDSDDPAVSPSGIISDAFPSAYLAPAPPRTERRYGASKSGTCCYSGT
jgi:hypothetical protein